LGRRNDNNPRGAKKKKKKGLLASVLLTVDKRGPIDLVLYGGRLRPKSRR